MHKLEFEKQVIGTLQNLKVIYTCVIRFHAHQKLGEFAEDEILELHGKWILQNWSYVLAKQTYMSVNNVKIRKHC